MAVRSPSRKGVRGGISPRISLILVIEQSAEAEVAAGLLALTLVKRLDLRTGEKWDTMLQGVTDITSLPEPMGTVIYARSLRDNLDL